MMFFDTHSHTNFVQYKDDADETRKRALDEGVWQTVVGVQSSTNARAIKIAEKYDEGIYAAVGHHPLHLEEGKIEIKELGKDFSADDFSFDTRRESFNPDALREMLKNPKVVALGEIGLDYAKGRDEKLQKEVFGRALDLAVEAGKPVIIHCREAHRDMIEILRSRRGNIPRGVFHCFSGGWEEAKAYLDMDFYLGFTGIITFSSAYDGVIKKTPEDKILAETDAPFLTPEPFRGKRNEPLYVKEVVARLKNLLGIPEEQIFENSKKFFKL